MTDMQWWRLASEKYQEQGGKCGVCGRALELDPRTWPRPQLAHRIKRGRVVRELGKAYEWHPKVLVLVCPHTKRGKNCNDGALIGAAHPLEEQALLDEIRGESFRHSAPVQPLRA